MKLNYCSVEDLWIFSDESFLYDGFPLDVFEMAAPAYFVYVCMEKESAIQMHLLRPALRYSDAPGAFHISSRPLWKYKIQLRWHPSYPCNCLPSATNHSPKACQNVHMSQFYSYPQSVTGMSKGWTGLNLRGFQSRRGRSGSGATSQPVR